MKLFIYDHCPYCTKARMIFGLKNIPVELVILLNDDEETPVSMIGSKMVPILEKTDGSFIGESMDIVSLIDENYGNDKIIKDTKNPVLQNWLEEVSSHYYKLVMPRWVLAPLEEFETKGAIDYFSKKKEAYIGDFQEHLVNTKKYVDDIITPLLEKLENIIENSSIISEQDIHLFAILRSLTIVKNLKFPKRVMEYLEDMSKRTKINLHFSISI